MTVHGPAEPPLISGEGSSRVLNITSGGRFELRNLTFINGAATQGAGINCSTVTSFPKDLKLVNCTIDSCEATTSGGGFYTIADNVILEGCVVRRCHAATSGGGGYVDTGEFLIEDCQFTTNVSDDEGGALRLAASSSGTIKDCQFEQNSAANDGGAINSRADLILMASEFFANESPLGAAIRQSSNNSVIEACEFRAHTAPSGTDAGAVVESSGSSASTMDIYNSIISGNKMTAFYCVAGTNTLTNVTIAGNRLPEDTITETMYTAGIVSALNAVLLASNCIIYHNDNGGPDVDPRITGYANPFTGSTSSYSHCILQHCGSSGTAWQGDDANLIDLGGNLDVDPKFLMPLYPFEAPARHGDFNLFSSSPAIDAGDNSADLDGGGAEITTIADISTDIEGASRIENGTVDAGALEGGTLLANAPPYLVTPLPEQRLHSDQGATVVLRLSDFFDPSASQFQFVSKHPSLPIVTIDPISGEVTITPNSVSPGLGRILVSARNANGTSQTSIPIRYVSVIHVCAGADPDNTLTGNSWANATNLQRALELAADFSEIWLKEGIYYPNEGASSSNSFEIFANTALRGGFAGNETRASEADPEARQSILSGDLGQDDVTVGGIVQVPIIGGPSRTLFGTNSSRVLRARSDHLLLDGLVITAANNSFSGVSGAALNGAGVGALKVQRCAFIGNFARGAGVAVYLEFYDLAEFEDCEFRENRSSEVFGGAAFLNNGGKAVFRRCQFISNRAQRAGGAVVAYNNTDIEECYFLDNSAGFLGAGAGSAVRYLNTSGRIVASVFEDNYCSGEGTLTLSNGHYRVENCEFRGNTASVHGGAIAIDGDEGSCTVINSLLSGNSVTGGTKTGGAIFVGSSNLEVQVVNTTITGNYASGSGGAISNDGADLSLLNCILYNNRAGSPAQPADHVIIQTMNTTSFSHSLVEDAGGSSGWDSSYGIDNGNNIDANPLFLVPTGLPGTSPTLEGNFNLVNWSPAINAGDSTDPAVSSLTNDLNQLPRFVNGAIDLGCYENSMPTTENGDIDGDGLSNGFEIANTSPPTLDGLVAGADPDEDGIPNLGEFFHGLSVLSPDTMPLDYSSVPEPDGDLEVTLTTDRSMAAASLVELRVLGSQDLEIQFPFLPLPISFSTAPHPSEGDLEQLTFRIPNISLHRYFFKYEYLPKP